MRIVTNEQMAGRNRKIATYLFFFSLAVLLFGFLFANGSLFGLMDPEAINEGIYLLAMPVVLVIGFTTTIISVRLTNLWIRQPRPEDAIQDGLKGISNKSALYNYFHLPARHVLICPQGIFPMVTRFQEGEIFIKNGRLQQKRNPFTVLFSIFRMDGLGNPIAEAKEAETYLRYLIEDYDPSIPVYPVVVFHDPRSTLVIEGETEIPVVHANSKSSPSLRDYIRSKEKADQFDPPQQMTEFIQEFETYTI